MRHYSHPGFHDAVRLDFEHAEQQRLLAEFRQAIHDGKDLEAHRARMVEFNESHFQLEEMLMDENAYAEREAHAAEHQWIVGLLLACTDDASVDSCDAEIRRHNGSHDSRFSLFLTGSSAGP